MTTRDVFMHRPLGTGWVTLCARIDTDWRHRGWERSVDVGVALCSPTDRFSKRIGRLIASGRREKRPAFSVVLLPTDTPPMTQIEQCLYAWLEREFSDAAMGAHWISEALSESEQRRKAAH